MLRSPLTNEVTEFLTFHHMTHFPAYLDCSLHVLSPMHSRVDLHKREADARTGGSACTVSLNTATTQRCKPARQ